MAGKFPALHWWPTIITTWGVALLFVGCALKISRDKDRTPFHIGVEAFTSFVFAVVVWFLLLGLSTWLGPLGQVLAVTFAGLASIPLFQGPGWARRVTLALHAGLVLSLLVSHAHFSSLQAEQGNIRYALQYGSGADALKPMLRDMPLAELYSLTEKTMRKGRGAEILNEMVKERSDEVRGLDDSQLEALSRGPMSDPLRKWLDEVRDARNNS